MTSFKPTIHHIVNGQPACGQGSVGYKEYARVFISPNACPKCVATFQFVDSLVLLKDHCEGMRETANKIRTHQLKLEVLRHVKQIELILNKFVK